MCLNWFQFVETQRYPLLTPTPKTYYFFLLGTIFMDWLTRAVKDYSATHGLCNASYLGKLLAAICGNLPSLNVTVWQQSCLLWWGSYFWKMKRSIPPKNPWAKYNPKWAPISDSLLPCCGQTEYWHKWFRALKCGTGERRTAATTSKTMRRGF